MSRIMVNPMDSSSGKPATSALGIQAGLFGRYELRQLVAESELAKVWRALDPRSGRDVRVKIFKPGKDVDSAMLARWVQETNGSSHLAHPGIVALHDAGVQAGQPFQVANWIAGQTLAEWMRSPSQLSARKSVGWMLEVLDVLVLAHAAGIVHGRLHPGNILIDTQGHARVMDFSQSTRVADLAAQAAQTRAMTAWLPADPVMEGQNRAAIDTHGAGMVLARLMAGAAWPHGDGAVADAEAQVLTVAMGLGADDRLRAIVQAAVANDPARRHASAHRFREQLAQWSAPSAGAAPLRPVAQPAEEDAMERLLRRMRENEDFPAMSHAVSRIQAMVTSDTESVGAVADEILKDVALSNKLLRIVNSAYYARDGGISSISRAVTLIGFNGVRNMAMGLALLESMQDKAHAQALTQEFLRALMAASIAREIGSDSGEGEEAFIGAMFQDLGRLLAMYYFPQEATKVQALVQAGAGKLTEDNASTRVLGLAYQALGLGVAKIWDLPPDIRRYMHKPVGDPPPRAAADGQERLRWTALAANQLADTLLQSEPVDQAACVDQMIKRFARAMDKTPDEIRHAMERARLKLIELAALMELRILPGTAAARMLRPPPQTASETAVSGRAAAASVIPIAAATGVPAMPALDAAMAGARSLEERLAAAIGDVDKALGEGQTLNDVLHMVLAAMQRSMALSHAVICMRDPKADALVGSFGLGDGVDAIVQAFHVPLATGSTDFFHAVCVRGSDMLIADIGLARIAERLPPWFRKHVQARSLLLLPITLGDKPSGLIFGDTPVTRPLVLNEKELGLLRNLRDRAQLAFRLPR